MARLAGVPVLFAGPRPSAIVAVAVLQHPASTGSSACAMRTGSSWICASRWFADSRGDDQHLRAEAYLTWRAPR